MTMVNPLPNCEQPGDDAVLWRYMDFTKYADLISTGRLFFSRADKLGDHFEGTYTALHAECDPGLDEPARELLTRQRYFEIAASRDNRRLFFINCWHENPHESAAMWRLYSQSNESVAIQTTFGMPKSRSAQATQQIYVGRVKYLDYVSDRIEEHRGQMVFMAKRMSYQHEREARLIFWSWDDAVFLNTKRRPRAPSGTWC